MPQPGELNSIEGEDWIKTMHWDLPTDVDELEQLMPLAKLITMPAWKAAPELVRAEVQRRLGRG